MRNVPNATMMTAGDVNTYAVLNTNAILLSEGSVEVVNKF